MQEGVRPMEFGMYELWKAIRSRWLLAVGITVALVAATGLLSYFVLTPAYEAKTTLLVQSGGSGSGEDGGQIAYNDVLLNQRLAKTYGEILQSRQLAEAVMAQTGVSRTAAELLEQVDVRTDEESLVTEVTVTDGDPETAVKLANAYGQAFQQLLPSLLNVERVAILDAATNAEDPEPVWPKPILNLAAALFVGLLAGVGAALLAEGLDRTVKEEEELEELVGVPVLGVIAKKKRKKYGSSETLDEGVWEMVRDRFGVNAHGDAVEQTRALDQLRALEQLQEREESDREEPRKPDGRDES